MRWFVWWSCWLLDGFIDESFFLWSGEKEERWGRLRGQGQKVHFELQNNDFD